MSKGIKFFGFFLIITGIIFSCVWVYFFVKLKYTAAIFFLLIQLLQIVLGRGVLKLKKSSRRGIFVLLPIAAITMYAMCYGLGNNFVSGILYLMIDIYLILSITVFIYFLHPKVKKQFN